MGGENREYRPRPRRINAKTQKKERNKNMIFGKYFYGNKVSDYGLENHRVDYRTFSKAFDAVLNNDIMSKTYNIGYWEQTSGEIDNTSEIEDLTDELDSIDEQLEYIIEDEDEEFSEEEKDKLVAELEKKQGEIKQRIDELEEEQNPKEIFQYYIISDQGAAICEEFGEIVFYNEELDMYVWGVTHYGTSWDYVLTDIVCNIEEYENDGI